MRLPHHLVSAPCFSFSEASDVVRALGPDRAYGEAEEITRLAEIGLPPVTSPNTLAVMMGYHPNFIWSILNRTRNHYRIFSIPKGQGSRRIEAPRVALKIIQKWLSFHFQNRWVPHKCVHGFVSGRSHITAAAQHLGARWVFSVDIKNFFPSTQAIQVRTALQELGYREELSLDCLMTLCCLNGRLVQGAPTSPSISNIALHDIDVILSDLADQYDIVFTRYADDIVFSGTGDIPSDLEKKVDQIFSKSAWKLSKTKRYLAVSPHRLKVHGLLVHGDRVRLTKRYRNRIRAYKYLAENNRIRPQDIATVNGHLSYAKQVAQFNSLL